MRRTTRIALLAAPCLLAAACVPGALQPFRGTVTDRLATGGLPPRSERALTRAAEDLAEDGLLVDRARAARRAVERTDAAIRGESDFDAAEAELAASMSGAVSDDRVSVGALLSGDDAPGRAARALERADRKLARAAEHLLSPASSRGPLLALKSADAAARAVADAFPPMPAFELTDVNVASPTSQEAVTVRGQVNRITAWYFIHST